MLLVRKTANNKLNPFSLPCIVIVRFIWTYLLICHHISYSQMAKSTRFIIKLLDQTKRQRGLLSHQRALRQIWANSFLKDRSLPESLSRLILASRIF